MGIFGCSSDVYLCCAADTGPSPALPVLLCYWDEAEDWDHWADIQKGKAGSILWAGTPARQVCSVLTYLGKVRHVGEDFEL